MSAAVATGLAITNPLVKYRALVATRQIIQDPAQLRLAVHLQKLYEDLKDYEPQVEYSTRIDQIARSIDRDNASRRASSATGSTWRSWLGVRSQQESLALTRVLTSHESAMALTSPRGLMLHGEVGTGKSMLIDLFADCLPNRKKRRWHFNTFMLESLARLESLRRGRVTSPAMNPDNDHALLWLAKDMIQESPILFLDEFQMPDRAASKILTNLMTGFFQLGGVLIATSNRMPEELDKATGLSFPAPESTALGGWQLTLRSMSRGKSARFAGRSEFAAFLEVLKARCDVWQIESGKDYRRLDSGSIKGQDAVELNTAMTAEDKDTAVETPATDDLPLHYRVETATSETTHTIESILAANDENTPIPQPIPWFSETVTVYGRSIPVPRAYAGICQWTFPELCHSAFGPADYITLASTYHTFVVTDVPVLTWLMKNEARRFITLLDALYESRCRLVILAAAAPDRLFFPERTTSSSNDIDSADAVHAETFSEAYQDATAPFRPNILTQNPNYAEPDPIPDYTHARLAGLLAADALEDDPPNRPHRSSASASSSSSIKSGFSRSFGRTDSEFERAPIDPDENLPYDPLYGRVLPSASPNFGRVGAFTGEDERFAYRRAQSRLWELCGARWWAARRAPSEEWHRPLPRAVRRWEQQSDTAAMEIPLQASQLTDTAAPGTPGEILAPKIPLTDTKGDAGMGAVVEDRSRDERSFKSVAKPAAAETSHSPFRRSEEPPPKFNWTHFWGTTVWGPRAGEWGQGPQGRRDRGEKSGKQDDKSARE